VTDARSVVMLMLNVADLMPMRARRGGRDSGRHGSEAGDRKSDELICTHDYLLVGRSIITQPL
jgi:hypothetical protein